MAGDPEVEIVKIAFGPGAVICENVEVCRYLTEVLKTSGDWKDQRQADQGWQVTLTFSNGLEYATSADLIPNGISLSIRSADPFEIGIPTHTVYFHEPVPQTVQHIWDFLYNSPGAHTRKLLVVPKVGLPYETRFTPGGSIPGPSAFAPGD